MIKYMLLKYCTRPSFCPSLAEELIIARLSVAQF